MDEPRLRAWMQEPRRARPRHHAQRPGRWVAEPAWPPPDARDAATWDFAARASRSRTAASSRPAWTPAPGAPTAARATGPATSAPRTGARSTLHLGAARRARRDPRLPRGRRSGSRSTARARSSPCACATSPPTARRCSSRAACSTSPTATATRDAEPLEPGHALRRHGPRSTRSPSACPPATACASRSRPRTGRGRGRRRAGHAHAARAAALDAARRAPPRAERAAPTSGRPSGPRRWRSRRSSPAARTRTHDHDPATGAHELRFEWDVGGHRRLVDSGIEMDDTNVTTYRIVDGDPLSAERARAAAARRSARGDWRTRVETDSEMTATRARVRRHATASTPTRATSGSARAPGRWRSRAT